MDESECWHFALSGQRGRKIIMTVDVALDSFVFIVLVVFSYVKVVVLVVVMVVCVV